MITVSNINEEYQVVEEARCECGGKWEMETQSLVLEPLPTDVIRCSCSSCGKEKKFEFDIKEMFGEIPID